MFKYRQSVSVDKSNHKKMTHVLGQSTKGENKCNRCHCTNYPSCDFKEEFCYNCIHDNSGFHLLMHENGEPENEIPDCYLLCENCDEYVNPEDGADEECPALEDENEEGDNDIKNE